MDKEGRKLRLRPELLDDLARTGSPVDKAVGKASDLEGLEIRQAGSFYDSKLFDLEDGRLGFMADLILTNQTRRDIYIADVQLCSTLIGDDFQWLESQELRLERKWAKLNYRFYKFPGRYGLDLPFHDVLNHVLLDKRILHAKRPVEGWLLGTGWLMPSRLIHGAEIHLPIVVTGSDHCEYREDLHLWVERNPKPHRTVNRRSNLFEEIPARAPFTEYHVPNPQDHSNESDGDTVRKNKE